MKKIRIIQLGQVLILLLLIGGCTTQSTHEIVPDKPEVIVDTDHTIDATTWLSRFKSKVESPKGG